jgi:hypothetical protein
MAACQRKSVNGSSSFFVEDIVMLLNVLEELKTINERLQARRGRLEVLVSEPLRYRLQFSGRVADRTIQSVDQGPLPGDQSQLKKDAVEREGSKIFSLGGHVYHPAPKIVCELTRIDI